MLLLLSVMMVWLLLRSATAMAAASEACRLFVQSVLPGLLPYMVLALMLVSRIPGPMPGWLLMLLGWCGGSPTGARLLALQNRRDRRLAVRCATMSPMFLLGTLGGWLGSTRAGLCLLASVLTGGWLAGLLAEPGPPGQAVQAAPMAFGEAVASAAQTLLMVCGSMAVLRVALALAAELLPGLALPMAFALEATTAARLLAQLPLPLPMRTALVAGAAGFGGLAVLLQNRACYPPGLMGLPRQLLCQAIHGLLSFGLALGLMLLCP